jgi:RNA polymerase sigma factor (sigma-70 family)
VSQPNELAEMLKRLKTSPTDEDSWRDLYRQLWPFVIAVIYRRLKGGEGKLAEDAAQEVFVRLLRSRPFDHIPDADSLRAYVWQIADNVAKTHLQKLRSDENGQRELAGWREVQPSVEVVDPESTLVAREVFDLAESLLESNERELLRLLLLGCSLGQAADQLGLSYSNAGVRLHRIRRKRNRGKTRGIGMIIRFPRPRESDSLRACRRPTILTACRTSN